MRKVSRPTSHINARAVPGPRPPPTRSARISKSERRQIGSGVRKKIRGSGKELLMCFGVLAALGLIALLLTNQRSREQQESEAYKQAQEKLFNENMQLGFASCLRAEKAGLLFVTTGQGGTDDALFGPFRNDPRVYNVLYDRNYTDGRVAVITTQKVMHPDRTQIEKMDGIASQDGGVRCCYGFAASKTMPLVVASKLIKIGEAEAKPKEGEKTFKEGEITNLGGTITVIVRADNDNRFDRARQAKTEHK